ncbi:hypothetical protein K491DRAFT_696230, partial [Lophiostoma macrostomum CBS 122681]
MQWMVVGWLVGRYGSCLGFIWLVWLRGGVIHEPDTDTDSVEWDGMNLCMHVFW